MCLPAHQSDSLLLALGGGGLALSSGSFLSQLLGELSHGEGSALSEQHHLEALEVAQVGAGLSASDLLNLGQVGELLVQVERLRGLVNRSGSLSTLQIQSELGQAESLQGVNHSFEVWSVNKHTVFVSDVSNNDLLAVVGTVVHEGNAAGLDELGGWLQKAVRKPSRIAPSGPRAPNCTLCTLTHLPFLLYNLYLIIKLPQAALLSSHSI